MPTPLPGSSRLRELLKPAGTSRLRELLKLYGCEDVVTPVDEDAFGRRSSELIRRGRELQRKQCRDEDQVQCSLSSESSFLRAPRLSAKNRARAMLPPQRPGTKQGSSPPAKKNSAA
jgi:hypothetical protein